MGRCKCSGHLCPSPLPPPDPPDSGCACSPTAPIFSIADLKALRHDDDVENALREMFDDISELPDLDDATASTCSTSDYDTDEAQIPTAASLRSVIFPNLVDVVLTFDPCRSHASYPTGPLQFFITCSGIEHTSDRPLRRVEIGFSIVISKSRPQSSC